MQQLDMIDAAPSARIADATHAMRFLLAGNAHVTFVSTKTGTRFTYRVSLAVPRPGDTRPPVHFVSVLTAPEHYEYLGFIFSNTRAFNYGNKSRIGRDAPSAKAFLWVWRHLQGGAAPAECEIWHEGRCGKCGRRLTDPQSISSGLGPVCGAS